MTKSVYANDPIASFLLKQNKLNPFIFTVISCLFIVSIYTIVAFITHTWISTKYNDIKGLSQDIIVWIWIAIFNPIILGFYCWAHKTPEQILSLFSTFNNDNIITISKNEVDKFALNYKRNWYKIFSFIVAVLYGITFFSTRRGLKTWSSSHIFATIITTIISIIVVYTLVMTLCIVAINLYGIIMFLKNKDININPWHHDKFGGLSSLGKYFSQTIFFGFFWTLIYLVIESEFILKNSFNQNHSSLYWFVHVGAFVAYLVVVYICFVAPLFFTHKAIQNSKKNQLNNLSKIVLYYKNHLFLDEGNYDTQNYRNTRRYLLRINELKSISTLIDNFPSILIPINFKSVFSTIGLVAPFFLKITNEFTPHGIKYLLEQFISGYLSIR